MCFYIWSVSRNDLNWIVFTLLFQFLFSEYKSRPVVDRNASQSHFIPAISSSVSIFQEGKFRSVVSLYRTLQQLVFRMNVLYIMNILLIVICSFLIQIIVSFIVLANCCISENEYHFQFFKFLVYMIYSDVIKRLFQIVICKN